MQVSKFICIEDLYLSPYLLNKHAFFGSNISDVHCLLLITCALIPYDV